MTCAHRTAITVISLTVLVTCLRPTLATDKTWINPGSNPGSGFWSGAGNWSPAGLPVTGDNLFLTNSPGQTVLLVPCTAECQAGGDRPDLQRLAGAGLGDLLVNDGGAASAERHRAGPGAAVAQPQQFAGAYTHRLRGLSIAQSGDTALGAWDLDADDLIVDYTGSSVAATIRQYLRTGNANGAGMGLKSTAAANNAMNNTALGYAEASEIFGNSGMFGGVVVDGSAVLVKYTYYGDTDLNGTSTSTTTPASTPASITTTATPGFAATSTTTAW